VRSCSRRPLDAFAIRSLALAEFFQDSRLDRKVDAPPDGKGGDAKKIVFVSESIENIAPGWRARETYLILNENEFIERFELAEPGKDFALYSEAHLSRQ
jgi:hypothetical protein